MPSQILIRDPTADCKRPTTTSDVLGEDIASVASSAFRGFIQPVGTERRKDAGPTGAAALVLKNDISTSPRLFGYFVCCIASIVSMLSTTLFYVTGTGIPPINTVLGHAKNHGVTLNSTQLEITSDMFELLEAKKTAYFYGKRGNVVQLWKLYGSIAVSSLLALITLLVLIAHFDSWFFPNTFRRIFADGSIVERNLLLMIILITIVALEISTSRFSVGEAQANVFFSTWTTFIASIINYEIWRTSAGRHLTLQKVLFDSDSDSNFRNKRFWLLLSIFQSIILLSYLEHTAHNHFLKEVQQTFDCRLLSPANQWLWIAIAGCFLAWMNFFVKTRCKISLRLKWVIDAAVSGTAVGLNGTAIGYFTGQAIDRVHCPSNLYFGLWGAFVVAIWIFSSLLQNFHLHWPKEEAETTTTGRRGAEP